MKKKTKQPVIGKSVYLGTALYVDDFEGGICKIVKVTQDTSAGKPTPFVEVKERPGHSYNWEYLMENQEEWKKKFGKQRGHADPDYREEFNRGF